MAGRSADQVQDSLSPAGLEARNPESQDCLSAKLRREADLLVDGVSSGFASRLKESRKHWAATGAEAAASFAIGAGLTLAEETGGPWGAAGRVGGALLTAGFGVDLGCRRLAPTIYAMAETWDSPRNLPVDKSVVADALGAGLFDYSLMGLAGAGGAGFGRFGMEAGARLPVENLGASDQFFQSVSKSVDDLPAGMRRLLAKNGAQVSVAHSITEAVPDLPQKFPQERWDSVGGLYDYERKTLVVPEFVQDRHLDWKWVRSDDTLGILRHEAGHGLDQKFGFYSHGSRFARAYQQDLSSLSLADRLNLPLKLTSGSVSARQEAFADSIATASGGRANNEFNEKIRDRFPLSINTAQSRLRRAVAMDDLTKITSGGAQAVGLTQALHELLRRHH